MCVYYIERLSEIMLKICFHCILRYLSIQINYPYKLKNLNLSIFLNP